MNEDILIRLAANSSNFESGVKDASGSLQGFIKSIAGSQGTWLGFATAATAAGAAIFGLAKAAAEHGEHLNTLSERTGVAVEDLSLLKFAAEQSETSLDELAGGMKFLQRNMVEAKTGNEQMVAAFNALGVTVTDANGKLRPTKDVMFDVADAIQSIQDPALKTKLMIEVMGRSASGLVPMFKEGSEGIQKMMNEAESMGLKMSTETAKQADKFNDSLAKLWIIIKQVGYDIGEIFIPPLQQLFEVFVKVVKFVKESVILAFYTLATAFEGLATTVAYAQYGIAKVTDLLGLTKGESEAAGKQLEYYKNLTISLAQKTAESFNTVISSVTGAAVAEEKLNTTKKKGKDMTDEQRLAALNAAEAYKKLLEENKKFNEGYIKDIDAVLEHKQKIGVYDEEYFAAYAMKLAIQGQSEKNISDMVFMERKKRFDDEQKRVIDSVDNELDRLVKIRAINQDYFDLYAYKLRQMGADETEVSRAVLKERIRLKNQEQTTLQNINEVEKAAVKGVADTIKMLWNDTNMSFQQAWKNAMNVFVDTMSQMVVNAMVSYNSMASAAELSAAESAAAWEVASESISISTAAATFGISLVVGLIAAVFTGHGATGGRSQILVATEEFLRSIKQSLRQFENETLTTLQKITRGKTEVLGSLNAIDEAWLSMVAKYQEYKNLMSKGASALDAAFYWRQFVNQIGPDVQKTLDAFDTIKTAIQDRYELEKTLINNVFDLLRNKADFVRSVDQSISQVTRSSYSAQDLLAAQKGDIQAILSVIGSTSGEQKVSLAKELQSDWMAYFNTAKDLYKDNAGAMAAIQDEVIAGLKDVKGFGESGYEQLIDIQLQALGVHREGVDLQGQMVMLLAVLTSASHDAMTAMQDYATNIHNEMFNTAGKNLDTLFTALSKLGFQLPLAEQDLVATGNLPHMAVGGIVTRRTMAVIGENGPEAVVPLNRAREWGGVQIGNLSVSLPNVKDVRDMTQRDWELALKKARFAAERLGRDGLSWGMA